jgi:hypothetical protein
MKTLVSVLILWGAITVTSTAHAQFSTIYTFSGQPDGAHPVGTPLISPGGMLFGLTNSGGVSCSSGTLGCGVGFSLSPPSEIGGAWTEALLYSFQGGSDGASANSNLIPGENGVLMGTTAAGGAYNSHCRYGCGTFFELTPPAEPGGSWTENVLFAYPKADFEPGTLLAGTGGVFYGASALGGDKACNLGCGSIYELLPPSQPGGAWTLVPIHQFSPNTGAYPYSPLIQDSNGVLYGMTEEGGNNRTGLCTGCGTVFSLTPPTVPGEPWAFAGIYRFRGGKDGFYPLGSLSMGTDGTLYGTTQYGGAQGCGSLGCGTVFSLVPPASGSGLWTKTTLYAFVGGSDGANPASGVVIGAGGVLYGATPEGGGTECSGIGCGVLYQLTPPSAGGNWAEAIVHSFTGGSDGQAPYNPPTVGPGGALYGVAGGGTGTSCSGGGCGVVYQYVP